MTLALFDFDGTISRKDSTSLFFKYLLGENKYYIKKIFLLGPFLIIYRFGYLDDDRIKYYRNRIMLSSYSYDFLEQCAKSFSKLILPTIIKDSAMQALLSYSKSGATIVIVSASLDIILQDWCVENGFKLITNKLNVVNGRITGYFEKPDCNFDHKKDRIRLEINLKDFKEIHAYGDSSGDFSMLSLASKRFYRFFK
jgi:HAD superfamily hydrolase (TIGR01490 family)